MTQESLTAPTSGDPDAVSPDELMDDFRGRPIAKIVVVTLIAHVLVVGAFSIGYLKDQLLGVDTSQLSEEERLDIAVREGTTALREIADRHNVNVQDLSSRFAGGARKPATPPPADDPAQPDAPAPPPVDPDAPNKPDSAIEQQLKETADGPAKPDLAPLEEDDDLFAPDSP